MAQIYRLTEARHHIERPPVLLAGVRRVLQVLDRLQAQVPVVDLVVGLDAVAATLPPMRALSHAVREVKELPSIQIVGDDEGGDNEDDVTVILPLPLAVDCVDWLGSLS